MNAFCVLRFLLTDVCAGPPFVIVLLYSRAKGIIIASMHYAVFVQDIQKSPKDIFCHLYVLVTFTEKMRSIDISIVVLPHNNRTFAAFFEHRVSLHVHSNENNEPGPFTCKLANQKKPPQKTGSLNGRYRAMCFVVVFFCSDQNYHLHFNSSVFTKRSNALPLRSPWRAAAVCWALRRLSR